MEPVRVAMLSWEHPPAVVGGLSRHVFHLSRALAAAGHEVTVYTRGHPDAPEEAVEGGVRLVRVPGYPPHIAFEDLVPWVLAFNIALLHRIEADLRERPPPHLFHAHDWLVTYASAAASDLWGVPVASTIHAMERGRHQGRLPGPMNIYIDEVERWLCGISARLIVCSRYMRGQVEEAFGVPRSRVEVVPNGVDVETFAPRDGEGSVPWAQPGERLLVFAGRLVHEKGIQTVIEALPAIQRTVGPVRFVVAGAGAHRRSLERSARRVGVRDRVAFPGFLDDPELRSLYQAADLVLVPSLYEPFGLVALETMAAGTPVVVADTGGLREIVRHGATGLRFTPGDPASLATAAARVLTDDRLGRRLTFGARRDLAGRHSWARVATRTATAYRRALRAAATPPAAEALPS